MTRPASWESHWPSDNELLGRAVVQACGDVHQSIRWRRVQLAFNCGSTLAKALVERYVDENGDLKP